MTAHALTDTEIELPLPPVWDGRRVAELRAEVGEAGLRDILRLFKADAAFSQEQLARAVAAGDAAAARHLLASLEDAAAGLGLAALAGLARRLRESPLEAGNTLALAREAERVRAVPQPDSHPRGNPS